MHKYVDNSKYVWKTCDIYVADLRIDLKGLNLMRISKEKLLYLYKAQYVHIVNIYVDNKFAYSRVIHRNTIFCV